MAFAEVEGSGGFVLCLWDRLQRAAHHLRTIGTYIEAEPHDAGREWVERNADQWQSVIKPEQLHEQRRATEYLDINHRNR